MSEESADRGADRLTSSRRSSVGSLKGGACVAAGCLSLAFAMLAGTAHAAPINVNSLGDVRSDDGSCTLREAVIAANTDTTSGIAPGECAEGSGADSIALPAGTIGLAIGGAGEGNAATGDLDVTAPLTIAGMGAAATTIDANEIDRAIELTSTLSLSDVTISDGGAMGSPGWVNEGGGIRLAAPSAELTATRTAFHDNLANGSGGTNGGAIAVESGTTATIADSTFTSNYARNCSGAICVKPGGTLAVTGSTFVGNGRIDAGTFSDHGGGIYSEGATTVTNSTFSGNYASGHGGAVVVTGGTTAIASSTLAGNTADADGWAGGSGGGIMRFDPGTVTVTNTILADNSGSGPDCYGTIVSGGHNLVEDTTGCTGLGGSDLTGQDPALAALADNGGQTQTRALLPASPAIDAGIGNPQCPATDQRGVGRPQGPACEIGAFETTPPSASITFPVDSQVHSTTSYNAGCTGATPDLCGGAAPNPDGASPALVEVLIGRDDGQYWNGSGWGAAQTWNPATGTSSWTYGFVAAPAAYTVRARATDADGYVSEPSPQVLFTVDDTAPAVTDVTSSNMNGYYRAGQLISVQVSFGEPVTVTDGPGLTLETGPNDAFVGVSGGSGTSTLTFNYTVAAGHNSPDLDYTGTGALALNGGTIRDAAGNDATVVLPPPGAEHSLGANKNLAVDTDAPAPPVITDTDPDSPANSTNPIKVEGTAETLPTTMVKIYSAAEASDCVEGNRLATDLTGRFATPGIDVSVTEDATTPLRATQIDSAGNVSGCSARFDYVEDSTGQVPVLTGTSPPSGANDNNPRVLGTAEPGSTVYLHTTASCTGSEVGSATAAGFASPGIAIAVPDNSTTTLYARITDRVGNVSGCSAPLSYTEVTPASAPPQQAAPPAPKRCKKGFKLKKGKCVKRKKRRGK